MCDKKFNKTYSVDDSSLKFFEATNKDFQWETSIIDISLDHFKIIWNQFYSENKVNSCITYTNNKNIANFLRRHGFKRIHPQTIYEAATYEGECGNIPFEILNIEGEKYYSFPEVYSYLADGIVYKITDVDTGKFYIGMTIHRKEFVEEKYNGTGGKWFKYYEENKSKHIFVREILRDNFKSPTEMYDYEVGEIRKYCERLKNGNYKVIKETGCMNVKTQRQTEKPMCPECGAELFHHKKHCSMFNEEAHKAAPCSECGRKFGHFSYCSQYTPPTPCKECKAARGHLKTCSHYTPPQPCPECDTLYGHTKDCSHYKEIICSECGGLHGQHTSDCSKCSEAGKCPECGYSYKSHCHAPTCSHYKPRKPKPCPECKGKNGKHKKKCSKYKKPKGCPECGSSGAHLITCSKYKPPSPCDECGKINSHDPTCSKHRNNRGS